MLFNLRTLLTELACVSVIGQIASAAPVGDSLNTHQGLEKRVDPRGMKSNVDSQAYTVVKKKNSFSSWADQKQGLKTMPTHISDNT